MENSSKALYMAGSLLISMLIISLLVYSFNKLGVLQSEKDKIEYEESITAFNKEYEAFDNKIMYGTSVISCINKAINNDQKYIRGGKWTEGNGASEDDALVNVEIELNNEYLEEKLEIYYFDGIKIVNTADRDKYKNSGLKWKEDILTDSILKSNHVKIPEFSAIKDLSNITVYELLDTNTDKKVKIDEDHFSLLDIKNDSTFDPEFNKSEISLYKLASNVTEYEIIIQNPDNTKKYDSPENRRLGICKMDNSLS